MLYNFAGLAGSGFGVPGGNALILDAHGNLYGTAALGGDNTLGEVFEIH